MSPSTLSTWAKGYTRAFPDRPPVTQGPVITALPAQPNGPARIPFIGLVEATVVQAFRETGLPLQRIRKALAILSQQDGIEHALASRRLYTDGAQVLYEYASSSGDNSLRLLTVVESGQRVFHEIISDYLKLIEFDGMWPTGITLPITKNRVLHVRPNVALGGPIFQRGGAPLSAVISRWKAGESTDSLADDYGVPLADIEDALSAIGSLAA